MHETGEYDPCDDSMLKMINNEEVPQYKSIADFRGDNSSDSAGIINRALAQLAIDESGFKSLEESKGNSGGGSGPKNQPGSTGQVQGFS